MVSSLSLLLSLPVYLQWLSGGPITSAAACGQPCDAYLHIFLLYSRTHQNKRLIQGLEMLTEMLATQNECGLYWGVTQNSDDRAPMGGPEDKISGQDIF